MSSTEKRLSVLRNAEDRGGGLGPAGSGALSEGGSELLSRAALFRLEADALRVRAGNIGEAIIRDQYFLLADRWSSLAAGLEMQFLYLVTGPE